MQTFMKKDRDKRIIYFNVYATRKDLIGQTYMVLYVPRVPHVPQSLEPYRLQRCSPENPVSGLSLCIETTNYCCVNAIRDKIPNGFAIIRKEHVGTHSNGSRRCVQAATTSTSGHLNADMFNPNLWKISGIHPALHSKGELPPCRRFFVNLMVIHRCYSLPILSKSWLVRSKRGCVRGSCGEG
ncbi:hypothetical protein EJ04DRAFT_189161 [Polyplosphaeria fusca]|uniref:Uncharacterized protein n=1 Tax=Polyplosphaeria fusca TaxID=682080 RepID=A0A9P4QJ49_9PLEO|nr:hypothetical protein EJ04DRAFT_189161 [Polyplosphaeria fusca]